MRIRKVKSQDHGNEPCNLCHEDEKMNNLLFFGRREDEQLIGHYNEENTFFLVNSFFCHDFFWSNHDFLVNSKKALDVDQKKREST